MIRLSAAAQEAVASLTAHYAELGRDEAIDRMLDCVERAAHRHSIKQGLFYKAPRPYPWLADHGFRWTKEGPYWIAFSDDATEPGVAAIFHETANIPGRL